MRPLFFKRSHPFLKLFWKIALIKILKISLLLLNRFIIPELEAMNFSSMGKILLMFREAKIASSKNFLLISKKEENKQENAEVYLMQGKDLAKEYNVHYMHPFNDYLTFSINLVTFIKKMIA